MPPPPRARKSAETEATSVQERVELFLATLFCRRVETMQALLRCRSRHRTPAFPGSPPIEKQPSLQDFRSVGRPGTSGVYLGLRTKATGYWRSLEADASALDSSLSTECSE